MRSGLDPVHMDACMHTRVSLKSAPLSYALVEKPCMKAPPPVPLFPLHPVLGNWKSAAAACMWGVTEDG